MAKPRKPAIKSVWSRPEPEPRPAPAPLSREKIVKAAIAIADQEGLEAVSLRNVAAKLGAGPMRLYTYTSTKEGLLALMIDELYGELDALGPLRGDFRAVLRAYAKRLRTVATKHRWFVSLLGGRPHPGPNALASFERLLAALVRSIPKLEDAIAAARVVVAWAVGTLHIEANDLAAERASGLDERGWEEAIWPWLEKQLETGEFPHFSRVVHEVEHDSSDAIFEHGLECVLDGVAAQLAR